MLLGDISDIKRLIWFSGTLIVWKQSGWKPLELLNLFRKQNYSDKNDLVTNIPTFSFEHDIYNCYISLEVQQIHFKKIVKKLHHCLHIYKQRIILLMPFSIGSYRRLKKRNLRPVQPHALRKWKGAREQFTRGADVDSPSVQHSLRKQTCGPRCKQTEMGATDHSWHSEKSIKWVYCKWNWTKHFSNHFLV